MALLLLQREIAICEEHVREIQFDKRSISQHYRIGLFVTAIQNANAIFLLLTHGMTAESRQILRALLETSIELELLKQDTGHIWNAQVAFAKDQLKTLKYAKSGNPLLSEISSKINISEHESIWERQLQQAKQMGGKALRIYEKFNRLKRSHEYEALYASLSTSVHSSYAGVIHDAFEVDSINDTFDVALYSEPSVDTVELLSATAASYLSISRETVFDFRKQS